MQNLISPRHELTGLTHKLLSPTHGLANSMKCLAHFMNSHRLVGLVVRESASRAEDPGFESRLHRDFFGIESQQ